MRSRGTVREEIRSPVFGGVFGPHKAGRNPGDGFARNRLKRKCGLRPNRFRAREIAVPGKKRRRAGQPPCSHKQPSRSPRCSSSRAAPVQRIRRAARRRCAILPLR